MKHLNWLDYLTAVLLLIGGLNWGLVGFFDFNLVSFLCFDYDGLNCFSRFVYGLVGLSAVYLLVRRPFCCCQNKKKK
ncbi:MAG TPA: DUF378 domain-containing protein [bacterium]|nr:DUF378 domain-containing protein [bacterium]HPV65198.1 DUF378 domain-containing protein [bacterium]